MPPLANNEMQVLSPRSTNVPSKSRTAMKQNLEKPKPKSEDKPSNPDRIDDKWRPPVAVTEPGSAPHTYMVGKKLGKGGFAVCFEGQTKSTSEVFALKVVKAKVEQKKMMEKFRTEMQIHAKMRHPNIVEFYRAFTLQDHTYVVLEMCENGSLTDMVKARSCLSLPEVRRFMIQICGGVKYMHKRNVIHRDLKMGNIFLDGGMNIKIGDFGLAAVMADEQDRRTTLCGTPNYIAPEILNKSGVRGHDSKVDTWAIGIIAYAMLVGVPPFQSKTQQEIYARLKTLDYEWKVDSKNYIPQQAKDFVTACLNLIASERPEMDDLVEHSFFKMGAIADNLSTECLHSKPWWLENADPRGDRVRPGYGKLHGDICAESGVGKIDGKARPAAGLKGNLSTLMEIEAENRQGCAPVTPLPEGILYRQFTDPEPERLALKKSVPVPSRPKSRKPMDEARGILSGSTSTSAPGPVSRQLSAARPTQSFAAQQRQQALPSRSITNSRTSEEVPVTKRANTEDTKAVGDTNGLLKAKPVRANSIRSNQQIANASATVTKAASTVAVNELSERLLKETDEPASRIPASSFASTRSRPAGYGTIRPRSAILEKSNVLPQSSSSSSVTFDEIVPAKRSRPVSSHSSISQRSHYPLTASSDGMERVEVDEAEPCRWHKRFKPRMIEDRETFAKVNGTSHAHVMQSLRNLHSTLDRNEAHSSARRFTRRSRAGATKSYPRVEKWVDYATKHGIAYLLTDGSLGMILKSRDDDEISSSCVVVRNAKRHTELRAKGREHQYVPQGQDVFDVEFYEQVDAVEPIKRIDVKPSKFRLDVVGHDSQSAAANALLQNLRGSEAQRLKEVGLLDKFGKYMHKQMGSSSSSSSTSDVLDGKAFPEERKHLIHFYQRLGNVGAWRYADGGIQFNFPDHTKLILYEGHGATPSELIEPLVDIIYMQPTDARDMALHGLVTHEALERRDLRTFKLNDIQEGTLRRSEMEILRTNEILEKLDWIRAVIGCWIREGGLGWTGDERLGWSGLQERREDKRVKLQWVTVGRPGGDLMQIQSQK